MADHDPRFSPHIIILFRKLGEIVRVENNYLIFFFFLSTNYQPNNRDLYVLVVMQND